VIEIARKGGSIMSDVDEHINNGQEKANGKFAQLVDKMVEGKVPVPVDMETMIWHYKQLLDTEKEFEYKISLIVRKEPIYRNYLSHIKGIGPVFAGNLLTIDVEKFKNISKLWAYAGYSSTHYENICEKGHKFMTTGEYEKCPVRSLNEETGEYKECGANVIDKKFVNEPMKRKRGWVVVQNSRLKMTMWKISDSFVKQKNSYYRAIYEREKAIEMAKEGMTKMHAHLRAKRKVSKKFLANFWLVYRQQLGLPVSEPYPVAQMGHSLDIPTVDDNSKEFLEYRYTEQEKAEMVIRREGLDQTIRSFYAHQKLRIQTYNRVVDYVALKAKEGVLKIE
jgi:hypothetical protein